jgi:Eco57I restriction-modification methylase
VYESVLDYVPVQGASVRLVRGGNQRKTSGSFYTPQSITGYLVRRTLHPLVDTASPDRILQLRIVDPSMGSAAFLVAACRYLAGAYERALIRTGECYGSDITESDRAGFRRAIAQRCLYGVDLNPTAVQLARLSLWLATLAADKPLSFLDHHLRVGDSLLGASFIDVARQPPGRRPRVARRHSVVAIGKGSGLFSDEDLEPSLGEVVRQRCWLADTPDDSLAVVREKEKRLGTLGIEDRWKRLLDLWCASWLWPDRASAPDGALFAALADHVLGATSILPQSTVEPLLARVASIAEARRLLHWTIEFPELYFTSDGRPLDNPGFDAVIGNPPWDMLRADSGEARDDTRDENSAIKRFFGDSGIYRLQGGGHINRYQLFVERSLMLLKKGGRLGLVLPSGIANDHTSAPLRRRLIDTHAIDALIGFENRRAIFPIHRSVRFVLLTSTSGSPTERVRCRFGVEDPTMLDSIPDAGSRAEDYPVTVTPALLAKVSRNVVIPQLRTALDARIAERVAHHVPRLADTDGWRATFGRELNATDDRRYFRRNGRGIPVLEGKHIEPFQVHVERCGLRISDADAERLMGSGNFRRARLAYRDVASPTNRVSLIAAILPAGVITTHSLFCLKTVMTSSEQHCLCGLLNSYVANYLVRQVMTTHLGASTIEDLRVPRPSSESALFEEIAERSRRLSLQWSVEDEARLQRSAALAYGVDLDEFRHIVETFPLIPLSQRQASVEALDQCHT